MIRYALACDKGHTFESWFANSATYDRQVKRGLVSCPVCNSTKVEKAIMAPRVAGTKRRGDASVSAPMPEGPASSQPSASKAAPEAPQTNVPAPVAMMSPQEREFRKKLKELREHLIRNADYVGRRFPEEARARCTTARSSTARSTARPRLTRPRSCTKKGSSFTRCPCCRTSGTDQRPTSTWSWPVSAHLKQKPYFFAPRHPNRIRISGASRINSDYHELENLIFNQRAYATL
jgi:hypothetical protein